MVPSGVRILYLVPDAKYDELAKLGDSVRLMILVWQGASISLTKHRLWNFKVSRMRAVVNIRYEPQN